MSTWYARNRAKAIENAKTWRLNNLDRYRAIQREAKRRKRAVLKAETAVTTSKIIDLLPLAPEGYDPYCDGPIEDWCRRKGIPNDPRFW